MSGPAASSSTAKSTWELNNNVQDVNSLDSIYSYEPEKQKEINRARPWRSDPHWFKKVKVSATALIKMVMHARSGGQYEVMGLMQGKLDGDTFIVLDAFPLPVQGTETRVNAGNEGNEFAVQYMEGSNAVGRKENVVGWYHSHPGYGCWLSGIDVSTQMTNQAFQDPFLSVVIDPNRTVSAGRVEIGAFRTYPENYTPPTAAASEYQSIPLNKIEDFGVHAARYYSLEVSHFKSSLDTKLLDLLWNKYWVMTLSQSPLVSNRAYTTSQISDLTSKLAKTESSLQTRSSIGHMVPEIVRKQNNKEKGAEAGENSQTAARKGPNQPGRGFGGHASDAEASAGEKPLDKAIHDATKVSGECQHGMLSQILKDTVFNCNKASLLSAGEAASQ